MRVGVISSAGGSAFLEVADACPHIGFTLITDRICGAEDGARKRGIPIHRVAAESNEEFSERAAAILREKGHHDFVIMFYSRLVTEPLLSQFKLLNIHPALLPSFKGLSAVKQAREAGVSMLGATLHIADDSMDGGPIVAQTCCPVSTSESLELWSKKSFMQKVILFLLAIDLFESGRLLVEGGLPILRQTDRLNVSQVSPALVNEAYLGHVEAMQQREGVFVFGAR